MTRLFRALFACAAPLVLIVAGCGGGSSSNPSNGTFSISPGTTTIDSNGQVQFTATLTNGQPATNVNWAMRGPAPFISKVMQVFLNFDRMIGKDFEEGLGSLKALAEK